MKTFVLALIGILFSTTVGASTIYLSKHWFVEKWSTPVTDSQFDPFCRMRQTAYFHNIRSQVEFTIEYFPDNDLVVYLYNDDWNFHPRYDTLQIQIGNYYNKNIPVEYDGNVIVFGFDSLYDENLFINALAKGFLLKITSQHATLTYSLSGSFKAFTILENCAQKVR